MVGFSYQSLYERPWYELDQIGNGFVVRVGRAYIHIYIIHKRVRFWSLHSFLPCCPRRSPGSGKPRCVWPTGVRYSPLSHWPLLYTQGALKTCRWRTDSEDREMPRAQGKRRQKSEQKMPQGSSPRSQHSFPSLPERFFWGTLCVYIYFKQHLNYHLPLSLLFPNK